MLVVVFIYFSIYLSAYGWYAMNYNFYPIVLICSVFDLPTIHFLPEETKQYYTFHHKITVLDKKRSVGQSHPAPEYLDICRQ